MENQIYVDYARIELQILSAKKSLCLLENWTIMSVIAVALQRKSYESATSVSSLLTP